MPRFSSFTALLVCSVLTVISTASAQKLVIKGSDTLGAKLVPLLAEAYKAQNPGVTFEIAAEGSTTGIAAIIDGTAEIGMSSRQAKPTEMSSAGAKGVTLAPTVVAFDGIAVIINAHNPLAKLTRRQLEQIFSGDVIDWSAVRGQPGKISVYTRNTASGTYQDFKDLAMNRRDYARSAQKMAGNEQIAAEVAKNRNGIGYVGLAYMHEPGVKVMAIDGGLPNRESILTKKYPLARPTFYYTNGEPAGEAAKFIAFTLGAAGRNIIEKVGFIAPEKPAP